jgi:predicted ATP-binding protein involved in virulence
MLIKQLRLQNFRGIKNLVLDFDITQRVVVLVGVNGVGKSSVLDCISELVRSYGLIGSDDTLQSVFQDRDIYVNKATSHNGLTGIFDNIEIDWDIERERKATQAIISTKNVVELIKNHESSHLVSVYYSISRQAIPIREQFDYPPIDKVSGLPNWLSQEYSQHHFTMDVLDIIDFKGFTDWFQELSTDESVYNDVCENYQNPYLVALRKAIYSMLGNEFSKLDIENKKLTIYKGKQKIELNWLSNGEKSLLALTIDLACRLAFYYSQYPDPLQGEGLVLIDEIELHLHPAWQRIIIQRLTETFPKCQFIVTTHSPQVLSNIQPECIHILALEDGNVVVKRPERSFGRDSNRILEDIMGVPKRPAAIEEKILELFRVIHDGELDQAKDMIQDLATEIGMDEPELIRATSTIRRREVIGR